MAYCIHLALEVRVRGDTCAEMSGYKLYYFDARGRAEMCRLAFAAANIDFEDVRLNGEEWSKEKACELN